MDDQTAAPALTAQEIADLAQVVIRRVAGLFEDWDETSKDHAELIGIDHDAARAQVALWMSSLPGIGWDDRLDVDV